MSARSARAFARDCDDIHRERFLRKEYNEAVKLFKAEQDKKQKGKLKSKI